MVQKFRFGKERYIKLIIFGSDRKKNCGIMLFGRKRSSMKRVRRYNTGEEGVGSRHCFAR